MGWGELAGRLAGIADGLLGLSPEERVKKLKNKIDKLRKERDEILKKNADDKSAGRISVINSQLRVLEDRIKNEAR